MSVTIKSLAKGYLANSENDVYAVPLNKAAIIKSIRLVNTDTNAITVNVYVRRGTSGTSYRILPKDLSIAPGACIIDDSEVTLEGLTATVDQDRIRAIAGGAANKIECVISGVERDQT